MWAVMRNKLAGAKATKAAAVAYTTVAGGAVASAYYFIQTHYSHINWKTEMRLSNFWFKDHMPITANADTKKESPPTKAVAATDRAKSDGAPLVRPEGRGKPRLIVLGSGWAAVSLIKEIKDHYDVSIVSPRNYFLFTPLLPGVTVGTNEERSIIEPVRKFTNRHARRGMYPISFYEAKCIDIDPKTNTIECIDTSPVRGTIDRFKLQYDYLVVAVGAKNNTFGTPGAEKYANFLKSVEDAVKIRSRIIDAFETANLPGQPEEERQRLLRFLVVGGGPTGVEYAAELQDLLTEDCEKYYPDLLKDVSVVLVQSGDHILNTFDQKISEYVEKKFKRDKIKVLTNTRVKALEEKQVVLLDAKTKVVSNLPYGVCVWSTGIAPHSLTTQLIGRIEPQHHTKSLMVDHNMKVIGSDNIFSVGDCSVVQFPKLKDRLQELFKQTDTNGDGVLSEEEFVSMFEKLALTYPQLQVYQRKVVRLFKESDQNHDGVLSLDEFSKLLANADSQLTTLPATAQVAAQQGEYLAQQFNHYAGAADRHKKADFHPFEYKHIASFAKIGSTDAVVELGNIKTGGFSTYWMWVAVYLSKQFSFRNRFLIAADWLKSHLFGRDVSRF